MCGIEQTAPSSAGKLYFGTVLLMLIVISLLGLFGGSFHLKSSDRLRMGRGSPSGNWIPIDVSPLAYIIGAWMPLIWGADQGFDGPLRAVWQLWGCR